MVVGQKPITDQKSCEYGHVLDICVDMLIEMKKCRIIIFIFVNVIEKETKGSENVNSQEDCMKLKN